MVGARTRCCSPGRTEERRGQRHRRAATFTTARPAAKTHQIILSVEAGKVGRDQAHSLGSVMQREKAKMGAHQLRGAHQADAPGSG